MGGPMELTRHEGGMEAGDTPGGVGSEPAAVPYHRALPPRKSVMEAYMLGIPLGFLGAHHFYLGRYRVGLLYLCTMGAFGVGWVVDWFRMRWLVQQANQNLLEPEAANKRNLQDAYVLWFPCGLIGLHHYYLGSWLWAVTYTFSCGLFGIGWVIDGVRMHWLVKSANQRLEQEMVEGQLPKPKRLLDCYVLGVSPLGLLGAHHYYLENWLFGVFYTFTLGLFGVGWVVDWCRMPLLLRRSNKRRLDVDEGLKYLDDAYVLVFPLGFLGLHHFYLRRVGWGFLYFFTFGCLGIGWLIDWFRLPTLVEECNRTIMEERQIVSDLHHQIGGNAVIVGGYAMSYVPPVAGQPGSGIGGATSPPGSRVPRILQIPPQLYPTSGYSTMTGYSEGSDMDVTRDGDATFPQIRPPAYDTVVQEDQQKAAAYWNHAYQDQPAQGPTDKTAPITSTMETVMEEREDTF